MHFWIDKRSQCNYTGRHRVPSSVSAGVGRGRGRLAFGGPRKGMAAPVHRFAALDPPPPRRPQRRNHGPPPIPVHRRQTNELFVEIPQAAPAQPTIAHIAAARSVTPDTLLRTAALGLQHSPVMPPHMKLGMLVSLALATFVLAGAKFYFDRQVSSVRERDRPGGGGGGGGGAGDGGEATLVCLLAAALGGAGCALALCRRPAPLPPVPPDRVTSTRYRHPAQQAPPPTPRAPAPMPPPSPPESEAPPPYHIALLLPARGEPPAYHAIS